MNKQIQRKRFSASLLLFEFRNITGNPYIHIFGIGLPVLMVLIFGKIYPMPRLCPRRLRDCFWGWGP